MNFFSKKPDGFKVLVSMLFWSFLLPATSAKAQSTVPQYPVIWGTDQGLYGRDRSGRVHTLWQGGKVLKIINKSPQGRGWALLTDQGILVSENLNNWEERNTGLPKKIIKIYKDGNKSFVSNIQEIKAFSVNPENPELMAAAVKDAVYLSQTGGREWENLGMPNYRSNGIKAVISFTNPDGDLTVFCSHSIYGVYYINPQKPGAKWTEMNGGIETLETTGNPDEISDFVPDKNSSGIYASQTFRQRIYKLDWERKTWIMIWSGNPEFGVTDSLSPGKNSLRFMQDGGIQELGPLAAARDGEKIPVKARQDAVNFIKKIPNYQNLNCVYIGENSISRGSESLSLSELWLLNNTGTAQGSSQGNTRSNSQGNSRGNLKANPSGKDGLYLPVNHAMDPADLQPYLDIIKKRNMNMVVIDMKDDYGRLRFTPQSEEFLNLGRIFRPVDLAVFIKTMKDHGIYTVARIVVFKDPEAAAKQSAKFAVWDAKNNKPWQGYYDTRQKKPPPGEETKTNPALVTSVFPSDDPEYEILRTWYDEKWVDPYSEEIWEYNTQVAEELIHQGFDEIQFDYIRFPTDGANLADARYRWQDRGMDMDGAILSFLRHVRSRVSSPISVDIYGANGWYRTGARTGQEVELLAPWVDVICPMYYPSHFEQDFLAQDPAELRPYRIYSLGTKRTSVIARNRAIVRPWVQAFYLNVSYDRKYYNTDYVRREIEGVREAGNGGFTYWNNSGRYEDIPDLTEAAQAPGKR